MTIPSSFELLRSLRPNAYRIVLFDFDGTLSLLREGWPEIMIGMMVEVLRAAPAAEPEAELRPKVEQFVMELNGQPTHLQMTHLAREVQKRGGSPLSAERYKAEYLRRLLQIVEPRRLALANGAATPADWRVAGSLELMRRLTALPVRLVLASGTDIGDVRMEADLLGFSTFFQNDLHGALPDGSFTKPKLIERLLHEEGVGGSQLLGFGDGVVETRAVHDVGGLAIGVASDFERPGRINPWKRPQLANAGAAALIPDFTESEWLVRLVTG